MNTRQEIDAFLAHRVIALAGASRKGGKFGNVILRDLRDKGYQLHPVHPEATTLEGLPCVPTLAALPAGVEGLLLVVPPAVTERLVQEAHAVGIKSIWMQQGAASEAAVRFCVDHGMAVVHGECILMFSEPSGWIHGLHRWGRAVFGTLPAAT
jgi:predicted CoA-binding protein